MGLAKRSRPAEAMEKPRSPAEAQRSMERKATSAALLLAIHTAFQKQSLFPSHRYRRYVWLSLLYSQVNRGLKGWKHFVQSMQLESSSACIQIQVCMNHEPPGCSQSHCSRADLIIGDWEGPCIRGYSAVPDVLVHPSLRIISSL